jgi:hypothetical protein
VVDNSQEVKVLTVELDSYLALAEGDNAFIIDLGAKTVTHILPDGRSFVLPVVKLPIDPAHDPRARFSQVTIKFGDGEVEPGSGTRPNLTTNLLTDGLRARLFFEGVTSQALPTVPAESGAVDTVATPVVPSNQAVVLGTELVPLDESATQGFGDAKQPELIQAPAGGGPPAVRFSQKPFRSAGYASATVEGLTALQATTGRIVREIWADRSTAILFPEGVDGFTFFEPVVSNDPAPRLTFQPLLRVSTGRQWLVSDLRAGRLFLIQPDGTRRVLPTVWEPPTSSDSASERSNGAHPHRVRRSPWQRSERVGLPARMGGRCSGYRWRHTGSAPTRHGHTVYHRSGALSAVVKRTAGAGSAAGGQTILLVPN